MSGWDRIADQIRIGGTLGRAMALLFGFVIMFLFLPRSGDDPVMEKTTVTGIVRLQPGQVLPPNAESWIAFVELADGRKVKVIFPLPMPTDGAPAPLWVERHQSGKARYSLDVEQWQAK